MIVYKCWYEVRNDYHHYDKWLREGWFLFGFIPLYIRDRQNRERY
jgi:hypothetical protein